MRDLNGREIAIFVPLIAVVLWMGFYPKPFLDVINPSVEALLRAHQVSIAAPIADPLDAQAAEPALDDQ
nr:hypothetical protein [Iodidimonas nitroreducens]